MHVGSIPLGASRAPPFLSQSFDDCTVVGRTSAFAERHVFSSNHFSSSSCSRIGASERGHPPEQEQKRKFIPKFLNRPSFVGVSFFFQFFFQEGNKKFLTGKLFVCVSGGIKHFFAGDCFGFVCCLLKSEISLPASAKKMVGLLIRLPW